MRQRAKYPLVKNLMTMGHCAPTVGRTLLQSQGIDDPRLIKLMAAMPGGIGNSGAECGGATAPLMHLGLQFGYDLSEENQVRVICLGQKYLEAFEERYGTLLCREISSRGKIFPCLKVIYAAPGLTFDTIDEATPNDAETGTAPNVAAVLREFNARDFHCCHSVFRHLDGGSQFDQPLLRASWGFLGGTALKRLTCGALTAGVMAIGLAQGQIENRPHKVIQMIGRMLSGGDVMEEDLNRFNHSLHAAHKLVTWFEETYGSCQCGDLLKSSASDPESWMTYLSEDGTEQCRTIAGRVAEKVQEIVA